ncbi:MAG: EAL domain-containing protein [Gammaproteobacteria bacterium]|nr:EAL domain-containing protein [Gammaproteobacteria bacterium]
MTNHSSWKDRLQGFPIFHSLRKQFLFLAILLGTVVIAYTWIAGNTVSRSSKISTTNIEERITVADLIHRLRRAIIVADDALNLYLLAPSEPTRNTFRDRLAHAQHLLDQLLEIQWAGQGEMLSILHVLKPLLSNLAAAGETVMTVRQDANLMYPSMRLANGHMLDDHLNFLGGANTIIQLLKKNNLTINKKYDQQLLGQLYELRDVWHRMISSYRLYLINRIGSLYNETLPGQIHDVEMLYATSQNDLKKITRLTQRNYSDIEILTSVEQLNNAASNWMSGYKEVLKINADNHWRGDLSLMQDIIHPSMDKVYEKLDQLENEIKQSANLNLVEQNDIGDRVIHSLWGMAAFVLFIAVASLIVVEFNFIRPIAEVARSLKDEAHGRTVELPLRVQAEEIRDLTDAFRELRHQVHSRQMALEHIAMHDSLTSLPNRALLMDRLQQAIENARKRERHLALIMLDLDRFKEINDTLGHQIGDALLQQVGSRLRGVLRDSDTVARLGGDEFAILLTNVNDANALRIATSIHDTLEKVYEVYEHSLYVGVSLGVAVYPHHGDSADMLLQHSDVAMYMAKRSNTGLALYDISRDQHSVSQLSVLSDLRSAIENDELYLEYQPKLSLADGRVTGVEALVRWRHPVHGRVMPDDFIPTAEQTGLIKRLSPWLLEKAVRDCKHLHELGHKISVSINLSVWDVQDGKLADSIRLILEQAQFPAEFLLLEITERVMMAEPDRAYQILVEIDKMGVKIVIDDFGTGFSSLVYLKQMPVDTLKIDKSFVINMLHDESDSTIVHSIIELAHNLGLDVVAEGVENDQTWMWLKKWRCDYAQGYYVSHPLGLQELENYLNTFDQKIMLN